MAVVPTYFADSSNRAIVYKPLCAPSEFDNKYKQTSFEKLKGFSIKSGKSNNKEESGEYPFYGSTGIIGYKSDYDYTGKAILIARVGANAGSLYQVDGKYSVSDNTLILAASDATNLDYVRELLVKFNLNRLVFGTGQPLVTGGLIKKVFISIPEVKEQTKIAYFLSAVDDKISQLTQEHELLSEYKKGIMQQIFSQKLRFKADDGSDFGDWEEGKLGDIVRVNPKAKELPESFFYIDLESVIPSNNKIRNSIDLLLNHMEKDLPYQDSLKYHFFNSTTTWVANFQKSAFENLKSEGINLISNKDLRKTIVEYYDAGIESSKWQSETYRTIVINSFQNVLNTRFESFWDSNYNDLMQMMENGEDVNPVDIIGEMVPNDFNSLKKDKEYLYFLRSLKNINSWHMDRMLKLTVISVEKLIEDIESELKLLK